MKTISLTTFVATVVLSGFSLAQTPAPKPGAVPAAPPATTPRPTTPGTPVAPDAAPKYEIADVMKNAMKGEHSLYDKAKKGTATDEELRKLYSYVQALPANKPPKGDEASWKEKTEALMKAVVSAGRKEAMASTLLMDAGNCKSCHKVHREEKP